MRPMHGQTESSETFVNATLNAKRIFFDLPASVFDVSSAAILANKSEMEDSWNRTALISSRVDISSEAHATKRWYRPTKIGNSNLQYAHRMEDAQKMCKKVARHVLTMSYTVAAIRVYISK
jgi:hypothetical protein